VVRCFDDPDIIHVNNKVDPVSDMETIAVELALADLDSLEKRRERAERALKVQAKTEQKQAEITLQALDKIRPVLETGRPARSVELSDDERAAIYDCHFITAKPQLYVCNVDEQSAVNGNEYVERLKQAVAGEDAEILIVAAKIESEIAELETYEERQLFLEELGLQESGVARLIKSAYKLLGLETYFTAGIKEVRAWTYVKGDKAPQAAGIIHSDFEKNFIRAEVIRYEDYIACGSEAACREAGKIAIEGKEYVVKDGDVMHFRVS
jgi:GTP-binding protein YchF